MTRIFIDDDDVDDACMCEWGPCDGAGYLACGGCGGDQCVCMCGGAIECPGCAHCLLEVDNDEHDPDAHDSEGV
jgi:hypothetical protein